MKNAMELTLTPKAIVDTGRARLYFGPVTEVILWRDVRTKGMVHVQPGEYIVQDGDGYPRRYTADDFALLYEPAPVPDPVVSAMAIPRTPPDTSVHLSWSPNGANDPVRVSREGSDVFLETTDTSAVIEELQPDTEYVFTLRSVNSYEQVSGGRVVKYQTAPRPVLMSNGEVLAATAVHITWLAADDTSSFAIYRQATGEKVGTKVGVAPAGSTYFNDTNLKPLTGYRYAVCAVSATGKSESEPSSLIDLTTSA